MQTIYDWITVGLFAAIVVLFLQRSVADPVPERHNSLLSYLIAAIGCGVGDYLGNQGDHVAAIVVLVGTVVFIACFLRPLLGILPRRP